MGHRKRIVRRESLDTRIFDKLRELCGNGKTTTRRYRMSMLKIEMNTINQTI